MSAVVQRPDPFQGVRSPSPRLQSPRLHSPRCQGPCGQAPRPARVAVHPYAMTANAERAAALERGRRLQGRALRQAFAGVAHGLGRILRSLLANYGRTREIYARSGHA